MLHPLRLHHLDGADAVDHAAEPADSAGARRRWWAMAVLSLAVAIGQLDMTIVNVALPSIAQDLGATTSQLQWVMDAYTVTLAGFVLLGGGLADRYDRKRVFMIGLVLFGAASMVGTIATDPRQLIAARAAMGLGAALFFPPSLSLLAVIFPPAERGRAIALWSIFGGVATALGPIVGGALVDAFWWGSALLFNVPVTIVALVGAAILLPRSTRPGAPAPDQFGALLSVGGLTSLVFAIIEGPGAGWTSPRILLTMVLGVLLVVAFVAWEARHPDPMVDVRVLKIGGVAAGGLSLVVGVLVMAGTLFLVPQYLQTVRGLSAITVGLLLVPYGATFAFMATRAARLVPRLGLRRILVAGLLLNGAAAIVLAFVDGPGGLVVMVAGTIVLGLGGAAIAPPATTAIMNSLPTAKAGDGSAINQVTRQIGGALGVAIAGTVLAAVYASDMTPALGALSPTDSAEAAASITGAQHVAAGLASGASDLVNAADAAFAAGYRVAMFVTAALCLIVAAAVRMLLPRDEPARDS